MLPQTGSVLLSYAVAVLATALSILLKLLLEPLVGESPALLFSGSVIISAWYGGLGPGLLATALTTLALAVHFLPRASPVEVPPGLRPAAGAVRPRGGLDQLAVRAAA